MIIEFSFGYFDFQSYCQQNSNLTFSYRQPSICLWDEQLFLQISTSVSPPKKAMAWSMKHHWQNHPALLYLLQKDGFLSTHPGGPQGPLLQFIVSSDDPEQSKPPFEASTALVLVLVFVPSPAHSTLQSEYSDQSPQAQSTGGS